MTDTQLGQTVMDRLTALARFTEVPENLTRRYLTPAYNQAAAQVKEWMEEAGMTAHFDAAGNVVGRYEAAQPGAKALLTGSHIDTVRDGGWYDGNLGVVSAIECVHAFHRQGRRLPFAIEIVAFGNEEGGRFPTTLTGSRAIAGTLDPDTLDLIDEAEVSLRQALLDFGVDPAAAAGIGRKPEDVLAFVELHIEQGPVLEAESLPVGTVTAINGASRYDITVKGMAGHAGTVPMPLRRDALVGASEMVAAVDEIGRTSDGLVATVGALETLPGAVNVVPGEVRFTLDVRAPEDEVRRNAASAIEDRCKEIAARRDLEIEIVKNHEAAAAACAPALMKQFDAAMQRAGYAPYRLPSGAGHDAMAFVDLCPIGMLFMRCERGISHHPDENVTTDDTDIATRVFLDFIENFEPDA